MKSTDKKLSRKALNAAIAIISLGAASAAMASAPVTCASLITGTQPACQVNHGGSVVNNGLISTTGDAGILVSADAVSIANTGSITGDHHGIKLDTGVALSGSIDNSGLISVGETGIEINSGDSISSITNSGEINANGNGILLAGTSDKRITSGGISNTGDGLIFGSAMGIAISNADITGGISNTGFLISGGSFGIGIQNSNMTGAIDNSGMIFGEGYGVGVLSSTISGGIINESGGEISSGSEGAAAVGISNSTIVGGVTNNGWIGATHTDLLVVGSTIDGGIYNNGIIELTGNDCDSDSAIKIAGSTISGGITNDYYGEISGDYGIKVKSSSTIVGGITNSGSIYGGRAAIDIKDSSMVDAVTNTASGTLDGGIYNTGSVITGAIVNDGAMINGGIYNFTGATIAGGIVNNGLISAEDGIDQYQATIYSITNSTAGVIEGDTGIYNYSNSVISNGIVNDGLISADWVGIYNVSDSTISGGIVNNGSILASVGIYNLDTSTINGGIINNGLISGSDAAIENNWNSVINGGIINATAGVLKGSQGIYNYYSTINGGIVNNGLISGSYTGIYNESSTINGGITNSGTIAGSWAGIDNYNGTIDSITNTGVIEATKNDAGIYNSDASIGSIDNSGTIEGAWAGVYNEEDSSIDSISNHGLIAATDRFKDLNGNNAGIYNTGDIGTIDNFGVITGVDGIYDNGNIGTIVNEAGGIISSTRGSTGTAVDLNDDATTFVNKGVITGDVILGDGSLELDAGSSMTGNVDTYDSDASVEVVGDNSTGYQTVNFYNLDTFTIDAGASIALPSVETNSGFTNNGTLILNDGTTTAVTGDYNQTNGNLLVNFVGANYGQMTVDGDAVLTDSTITTHLAGNIVEGTATDVVTTLNGGILSYTGATVADNSYMWDVTIAGSSHEGADGNIDLGLAREHSITEGAAAGGSGYASGIGAALDQEYQDIVNGATPPPSDKMLAILEALNNAPDAQTVADLIDELVPTQGGSEATNTMLTDVTDAMNSGAGLGAASGDSNVTQGVWVKYYDTHSSQDSSSSTATPGFDAKDHGVVVGYGIENGPWSYGVAVASSKGSVDGNHQLNRQSLDSNATSVMGYVGKQLSMDTFADGSVLMGRGNNDTERTSFLGTAEGSYDNSYSQVRVEAGKTYSMFTPTVDLTYSHISEDGYSEKGAGAMNVSGNTDNSLVLGANLNASTKISSKAALTGYAGLGYEFLDTNTNLTASLQAGGPQFKTKGADQGNTIARYGVGVNVSKVGPVDVSVNYDGQQRSDFDMNTVSVKGKYNF